MIENNHIPENNKTLAAFGGFRSVPPRPGGAGSDKFAVELYSRLAASGYHVLAYCRIYPGEAKINHTDFKGINLIWFRTINRNGLDTLLHSFKCTFDIIVHNRAEIIHIHSGANSLWAIFLRLFGKKVIVSQFAMDWKRDKWPWYAKIFYHFSNYITAYIPNRVVFDNVFTQQFFENKFKKKFGFIPYGSEVSEPDPNNPILRILNLVAGEYFLFVGRFIPDKGIHILIEAFKQLETTKKLVLIGNSPIKGEYEKKLKNTTDPRVIFPGYIYGEDTNFIMKNAYVYVQPSLIEGLSPVILTVMGLGTPLICSNIPENLYITEENATHFKSGEVSALLDALRYSLENPLGIKNSAKMGQQKIRSRFNWDSITQQYINTFETI